jgi:CheY-like chemotaxis protein
MGVGHEAAADKEAALAALERTSYDAVLLGLQASESATVVRAVEALPPGARRPRLIGLTVDPGDEAGVRGRGLDDVLATPFRADDLRRVMDGAARSLAVAGTTAG